MTDSTVDAPESTPSPPRWVSLTTALGLAMAAIVTAQVLAAISEGMALGRTEPQNTPGDVFHRLGYPFGSLGASAVLYLIAAVALVSLPPLLGKATSERQELAAAITLGLTAVVSVVVAVGSVLAARYTLHLYSANHRSTPTYVRVQLVAFLLGAVGASVVAFVGSVIGMRLREASI